MSARIHWYASKAAADRGMRDDGPPGRAQLVSAYLMLYDARTRMFVRSFDVTGRSPQHVDRLARDWIAHGVAPTAKGGRGVHLVPCEAHPREYDGHCWRCHVDVRHMRAEARARRVVRR